MANKTNFEVNNSKYFRVTATVGKDSNGDPVRKVFYGKSKKEAESKRDDYLADIRNGLATDYRNITLKDLMYNWLFDVMRISTKPSTFDRYESIYRNYVKDSSIAQMRLYEIRSPQVQKFYNTLADNGTTKPTIAAIHKILRAFFNYAMAQDYILKNPCFKLIIPGEHIEHGFIPFTDEEISKIKAEIKDNNIEMLFLTSLGTGMRIGELLALTLDDIDLVTGEVTVGKSLKKIKHINSDNTYEYKVIIQEPKTKNSLRVIPVPDGLIKPLEKYITSQKEVYLKNGLKLEHDSLLFTTQTTSPYNNKNLLRAWERVLRNCNIPYRNWHTIRHTYATKLFEARVDLKRVQILLGHANINITANTYITVMPKEKETAVQKINYLFN